MADRAICDAVAASYLEANGHTEALERFLATCPSLRHPDFIKARLDPAAPTLDSLVFSHRLSSASVSAINLSSDSLEWLTPRTRDPIPRRVTRTLKEVHASNILTVNQGTLPRRRFDTTAADWASSLDRCIITTAVDKTIKFTSVETWEVLELVQLVPSSPVLAVSQHPRHPQLLVVGAMSGDLVGWDLVHRQNLFHLKDHTKYVVRLAFNASGDYLATASYDGTIRLYTVSVVSLSTSSSDPFEAPLQVDVRAVRTLHVPTSPEALLWTPEGRAEGEWLLYSRREDCFVRGVKPGADWLEEKWNINANGDLWVSYDIVDIALPTPRTHISLLLTSSSNRSLPPRLLLLPLFRPASSNPAVSPFLYTTASTSPLVLSRHVWSPSGGFCFVTGDDGCLCILRPGNDRCDEDKVGVHGPAAPLEEGEIEAMDVDGGDGSSDRRAEVARRVREMRKGEKRSGVVRDVCAMDKPAGGLMVVTVGFDWTVRVLEA